MRLLVLGAGLQGTACAWSLLRNPRVALVTLADHRGGERLPPFLTARRDPRLQVVTLDARDESATLRLLRAHDAALCALPYYFNEPMTRLAIEARCHYADLGGNTEIVQRQERLHPRAVDHHVSVIPDCGLAPGMVNVLAAEGIRRLDRADAVRIYVGGLPQQPEPPLNYQIVYSLEGALDYYTTPSWIVREGRAVQVEPLTEIESVTFPPPLGTLEAFHTAGGISTMPFRWQGKVRTMEYKTLRYPGHAALMSAIRALGLLDLTPIEVRGQRVVPREVFIAVVTPRLLRPANRDLVALRVVVTGERQGVPAATTFELLDYHDPDTGISAMMRTTGFSLAITGQLQVEGKTAPGVRTPDEAVPFRDYVDRLADHGVRIVESAAPG